MHWPVLSQASLEPLVFLMGFAGRLLATCNNDSQGGSAFVLQLGVEYAMTKGLF